MRNKNFKNIGNVAINEISLCNTTIGLYMPIEKMSKSIRTEYEKCEEMFDEAVKSEHPWVNLTDYTLYRDIALHMDIEDNKVRYSVAIILWIEDEQGKPIYTEFFDPFEVEINAEDNKYLKKLVINKLINSFF